MSLTRRFFFLFALGFAALSLRADDMDQLNGKWSVKKKSDEGQAYTQVLEITKGKFKFQMIADGETRLYAEGDVKIEKHGPFNALKFANIKAGKSASDTLNDVDDDRTSIYQLGYETLTLAGNLDKERDQGPQLDKYTKETAAKAK